MDDQFSPRFVRLRLEKLEDRLAPSVSPAFNDTAVADTATTNTTSQRTTPVVGVAADNSFVVAWEYTNPTTNLSAIYARQFNSDGTAKAAAFLVASGTTDDSQPAIAVASDGHFIIAYTKTLSATQDGVYYAIYNASGALTLGQTAAPSGSAPGVPDDFSPSVAVSDATGQFVIAWVQQNSAINTDVYARAFQADGTPLINNDVGVSIVAGLASDPQVAIAPNPASGAALPGTFVTAISYTLNQGAGLQKVYFRTYAGLTENDTTFNYLPWFTETVTNPLGVAVSGTATSALENNSALAFDANYNLTIAWSATPIAGGATQVLFQQFNAQVVATFGAPVYVNSNIKLNETDPGIALNSDDRFLIDYVGSDTTGANAQIYFREFSPAFTAIGPSRVFSSAASPSNASPRVASSGNNFYVIVDDDLTGSHPEATVRAFEYLTTRVGVVSSTSSGLAQFALDSNGNDTYDSKDSVFTFGYFTDTFVIGDWNGSGTDKVGIVRPDGVAAIWALDTNGDGTFDKGDQVFIFGRASDQMLIGDWNGAGKAEIGVVRPYGGTAIFSLDTNGDGQFDAGDQVYTFGLPTDKFVIGDWNGSGTSKIGVVRANSAGALVWSLDTNGDGVFDAGDQVDTFGLATDTPIVGDWTGSGKTEIGVVRTNSLNGTATFILDTNGDGVMDAGDTSFTFGVATDKFIVGKWKPTAQPQFASSPGPGVAAPLTNSQLSAAVQLAIQDWSAAGLDAQQISQMESVHFNIAQLNDNLIGLTEGNTIDISDNADGWGWNTTAAKPAANQMDLVSTVSHELGHIVGLKDTTSLTDVMGDVLAPGVRRLPTTADVDAVFAEMGQ